jgi:hypothetical protein
MFHRHSWVEKERFYAEPLSGGKISSSGIGSNDLLQRMAFGVTSILYSCRECDAKKTKEVLGKATA